jgi:peptidyl-prolyl cis-trans isomerase A (cyclophilin A)
MIPENSALLMMGSDGRYGGVEIATPTQFSQNQGRQRWNYTREMNMRWAAMLGISALAAAQSPPASTLDASKLEPGLYAIINTSMGSITALLFEKETPNTVANFIGLARGTKPWLDPKTHKAVLRPLYANITFHRVIPQFMIQTGDPTGVGNHNCGFTLKDEIVPGLKFDRPGRLAMANIGEPDSGGCQFFITEVAEPSLNGKHHTIFGQVVDGQDVVFKISHVIRDENDKPRLPIKLIDIKFVRIVAESKPKAPAPQPPAEE